MSQVMAVGYLRISTDDRGQDVERQLTIIRPWCDREGVELADVVRDEGTSASKTNPFDRPAFVEACERAKAAGASAIVVECSDRFSRQGTKLDSWAEVELERRYGLVLYRCDKARDAHGSMVGNVSDAIHAEGAAAWVKGHSAKVASGMARAKAKGARFGRPAKPLSAEELELVRELRAQKLGWRRCAQEVSKKRGADDVYDRAAQRRRTVSHSHVKRCFEAWQGVPKVEVSQ